MNLQTKLDTDLWASVPESLEARNYSAAILDAVHHLSDLIRERSGLDADGVQLIGIAFGGTAPKLKVTKLQTESERNVQRGVEALLRGVYQALRNPRSHNKHADTERDASAIIIFIDYLERIVGQSRTPFSLPSLVGRILDRGFVPKPQYAQLLLREIPERQRLAVCLEVFARRDDAYDINVKHFYAVALPSLAEDELREFYEIVSQELAQTDDESTVLFCIHVLPHISWPQIAELSRLRTEHRLLLSVRQGRKSPGAADCRAGGLGTWITSLTHVLSDPSELSHCTADHLLSDDPERHAYAFQYLTDYLQQLTPAPPTRLRAAIIRGLKRGDRRFKTLVDQWQKLSAGGPTGETDPWVMPFRDALAGFVEVEIASMDDDMPF